MWLDISYCFDCTDCGAAAFLVDRLILQIGCGRDQMAAALLPVGVGGDAVPLRHESRPRVLACSKIR